LLSLSRRGKEGDSIRLLKSEKGTKRKVKEGGVFFSSPHLFNLALTNSRKKGGGERANSSLREEGEKKKKKRGDPLDFMNSDTGNYKKGGGERILPRALKKRKEGKKRKGKTDPLFCGAAPGERGGAPFRLAFSN